MANTKYDCQQMRRDVQPPAYHHLRQLVDSRLEHQNGELTMRIQAPDSRSMQVSKLDDLSIYRCKLFGDQPKQDEIDEDQERDDDLRLKIEKYNRSNRASKEKEKDKTRKGRRLIEKNEGRKRKIRTTITQQKLDEMNRIFSEHIENKDKLAGAQNMQEDSQAKNARQKLETTSLKSIGDRLGLGYSTILHKFRQFRATKKVKGGALIAATQQKRKYKKSKDIEELIEQSLSQRKFFTAVELSKYIYQKHHKSLSRSIISRHLGEMGYSYKNIKTVPTNKNATILKHSRKEYVAAFTKMKEINQAQFYFMDECTFTIDDFPRKEFSLQQENPSQLSVLLVANMRGILKYCIKDSLIEASDFEKIFDELIQGFSQEDDQQKVIVLDTKNIHKTESILDQRSRLKRERHTFLFYTPPCSGQLNLLTFIFQKMKAFLKAREFDDSRERLCGLQEACTFMGDYEFDQCQTYLTEHIRKAYRQENF